MTIVRASIFVMCVVLDATVGVNDDENLRVP